MASPPIYNPVIPCVHPIPGGLFPGRMIRIQGTVPPGGQRFAINLQCGPNTDPRDDIALHLNFRFVEMCVVRNHLTAMNWGVEETSGGMPLARGQAFEALLLCDPQSIKVALNGAHFCEFPHRVPFQRISHITVDGDVDIQFIGFEGAQAPPQQQNMYMSEPPSYAYGAPPPAYGAPGYGAPQGFGGQSPNREPSEDKPSDLDQSRQPSKTRIVQNPETNEGQSQKTESNQPDNSQKCNSNQELNQKCDSDQEFSEKYDVNQEGSESDDNQAQSSKEKFICNVLSTSKSKQALCNTTDEEELKEDRNESDRETALKLLDSVSPLSHDSPKKFKPDADPAIESSPPSSELECVLEPPSNSQTTGRNSNDSNYSVISTKQILQMGVKNVDYKTTKPESQLRLPFGPKKVEFVKIQSSLFNGIDGPLFDQNFLMHEEIKPHSQSSIKSFKQEQKDVSEFPNSTSVSSNVQVMKSFSSHSEHVQSPIQTNLLANPALSQTQSRTTFATGDIYFEELQSSYESWDNSDKTTCPESTDMGQVDKPASKLNIETADSKTGHTQREPNDATNSGSNGLVIEWDDQPIDNDQIEANPIMCSEETQTDRYSNQEQTRRIMPTFFAQEENTSLITISQTFGKLSPLIRIRSDQAEYSRREFSHINPNTEIPIVNPDLEQSSILCPHYDAEEPQPVKSLIEIQPRKTPSSTDQRQGQLKNIPTVEPDISWKRTVQAISESSIKRQRSQQNASDREKPGLSKTSEKSCCITLLMGCYTCLFCDKCCGPWGGDSITRTSALDFATPSRENARRLSTVSGASEKTAASFMMSSVESLPK